MMGYDLNTTEATAGLAALLERATKGPWRVETDEALIWGDCDRDDMTTRGMGYPIAYAEFAARSSWAKGPNLEQGAANAALILLLANHIGDADVLRQALDIARADASGVS